MPKNPTIDAIKLKAAAEHLEWVLRQYPDSEDVQSLLEGLLPLIEDAKTGRVKEPAEKVPFGYHFAEGIYIPYKEPNVEQAYVAFSTEMEGGLTEDDIQILEYIGSIQESMKKKTKP